MKLRMKEKLAEKSLAFKKVNSENAKINKSNLLKATEKSDDYKGKATIGYKRAASVYIKDSHDGSKDPNMKSLTEQKIDEMFEEEK